MLLYKRLLLQLQSIGFVLGPTGESPEENQTVVQLRSRFIAGNALEIRWVLVGSIGDEVNTNVGDNISEMQWELSNTSSVYAVLANETCDVPVLPTICHFNQSQVSEFLPSVISTSHR